jgi:hypothetical protein
LLLLLRLFEGFLSFPHNHNFTIPFSSAKIATDLCRKLKEREHIIASSVFLLRASCLTNHFAGYRKSESQRPNLRLHPTSETDSYRICVRRPEHDSRAPQNRRNKNDSRLHCYSDTMSSAPFKEIYILQILYIILVTYFTWKCKSVMLSDDPES